MEKNNVIQVIDPQMEKRIETEREGLKFTKNFRSATAEEWYVFLPGFKDPKGENSYQAEYKSSS